MNRIRIALGAAAAIAVGGLAWQMAVSADKAGGVTTARLLNANADSANWLSYGRTHDEQRFSPLTEVNDRNVAGLGLAWYSDLETARGQEATPIVVDGVMYVSTAWSLVKAYDAATGRPLWSFDPKVPRETLVRACCDAVNRGVAVLGDKVFVGALDGRLIALNARTGRKVWEVWTARKGSDYTITGAPRIVKGRVVIGNGGAEYRARGYISAYDAQTGKLAWRFYTVPRDPKLGQEQPELTRAAKTWTGQWWKYGGGGTVWDTIVYDPATNLIYFGTGNGEPWNASLRSPQGGDNLFTSSIVAVNADTGRYAWHFQETPQDRWDFDSDAPIMTATLSLGGKATRVVMHAPKNGFFYVLEARTGKFLSGKPITTQNWTTGLDAAGKPKVVPEAMYDRTGKLFVSVPGAAGAHSWHPMSYSPKTGLVYIPVNEAGFPFDTDKDFKVEPIGFNHAIDGASTALPADPDARDGALKGVTGRLLAWNPVTQKEAWAVPYVGPWNGGTLATAGNLVFQGVATGDFNAYAADSGKKLWSFPAQTGIIAAPMTYSVKGQQYVAVLAGWGGVWDIAPGVLAAKSKAVRNISRLLVFKLGAKGALPAPPPSNRGPLDPPPVSGTPAQIAEGAKHYGRFCNVCHGDAVVAGGLNPDLRHSAVLNAGDAWQSIVHGGALHEGGMVSWAPVLSKAEVETIRLYVIKRANEDLELQKKGRGID